MTHGILKTVFQSIQETNPDVKVEQKPDTIFGKIPVSFETLVYKIALSQQNVFLNKKIKDEFYEATMQLLKSLWHKDEENKANSEEAFPYSLNVIPIIVFDGQMFECYYDDTGELKTPEIKYTRFLSHGLPKQRFPVLIDIVTLSYFPEYLKLIETELQPKTN